MSNSVEILIKADDQASKTLQAVGNAVDASATKFQAAGKRAKAATEIVGVFATITGSSELGGFASQIAGATEKLSGFAEQAKKGGTSSLAFKAGLAGLVGTIAFGFGKALADVIWKTAEFNKQLEITAKQSQFLDRSIGDLQSRLVSQAKQDVELIADPAQKQAAYKALLNDLNKNIEGVSKNVEHSRKEVLRWAESWQVTGNRKQYAKDAEEQLRIDMERLEALKRERDEILRNTGEREKNLAAIRAANAAKEKSQSFVQSLREEVQYLKASADEQRRIEAMRNAIGNEQGEAYRLLTERDAIKAKIEAEKDLEAERKRAIEEQRRAQLEMQKEAENQAKQAAEERKREAEQLKREKEREIQEIEQLKASERERLDLMRIEIEQGKEAARIKELMNKGIDQQTAQQLVAEQSRLEQIQASRGRQDEFAKNLQTFATPQKLMATESRLLTRGTAENQTMLLQRAMVASLKEIQGNTKLSADAGVITKEQIGKVVENTKQNVKIVVPQ